MTAVLHTHTRRLDYHPHLHVIVPGGGIHRAKRQWKRKKGRYLFNQSALAIVFRARFLAAMNARSLSLTLPGNRDFFLSKNPECKILKPERRGRGVAR